jgi:putative tryptophan/tyrosine transport system substrate-binding protein
MRRREFIGLIGGAGAAWSFAARAQKPALPVLGFLDGSAVTAARLSLFFEGLKTEGFVRNQNVAVDFRSAQGDYGRLPAIAADLVKRGVAAIATAGVPAALAAKSATTTIPIVFSIESDPVQIGLVGSLNRPGGNITGVTTLTVALEQKRLGLLHELIPAATNFALLVNPGNPNAESQKTDALAATGKMGIQINVLQASSESDFEKAFAAVTESRTSGLAIGNDALFLSRIAQLAALALRHAVPAIFQGRDFVAAGGLMGYGGNLTENYHQTGTYSGLILKGAKAADLPVFQSTQTEFMINLKTAKALNLTIPAALLRRADMTIE